MGPPRLEDHGLSEAIVEEVRAHERRQFELFLRVTGGGVAAVWAVLTVLAYSRSFERTPLLGLVASPLLALLGAAIAALPLAIICGSGVLLLYPRHPRAKALEQYEAATAHVRSCDVCVLARGDDGLKEGVAYCARCDAWLCPACRGRYDLRAIAALRARAGRGHDQ
jgi:hypothetical protein